MDRVASLIESITKPRHEEDFTDRLNYRITALLLVVASVTIFAKEYGGEPIHCWLPAELAQRNWEEYAKDYCFIESTYYVPIEQNIPFSTKHRSQKELPYYQWVPFVLMLQALMFTAPHVFWRMLNWMSGIQTRAVITMASNATHMPPDDQELTHTVDAVARHLDKALRAKELYHGLLHTNPLVTITRMFSHSYLSGIYIFTKLLFIVNALAQFWVLSTFLGANGYEMTKAMMGDRSWRTTGYFPRVTMCDFKVHGIGNKHNHRIQCVLMANMFNEKIYIALWWWVLILIVTTCINLFNWMYFISSRTSKYSFLLGLVRLGLVKHPKEKLKANFIESFALFVGGDGTLVLRLMAQNAGEMITSAVVARLFELHVATLCTRQNPPNNKCSLATAPVPSLVFNEFYPKKPNVPFSN